MKTIQFAIVLFVVGAAVPRPAEAQTVAVGSYYATPAWDQTLPAASRFIVLSNFKNEAVLDRETGLVWEKGPIRLGMLYADALATCANAVTGGRAGWRLPSFHELSSLGDPATDSGLPSGHPFVANNSWYWSATTVRGLTTEAWAVAFDQGVHVNDWLTSHLFQTWCVRSGGPLSAY
jgi:hypothetical protein